ncbi:MAG: ATP-binding protein [Candidatus Melainabacteria bacterium]|nr:ATP-binding protein [Candidatus Melainabacteria bacterium]
MKAELLKRLFHAIADENDESLKKLTTKIIEEERLRGHEKLAKELEAVLQKANFKNVKQVSNNSSLKELPTSRRYDQPLAAVIPPEKLRHHMVLPHEIEERFVRIEKEYAARERLALFGLKPKKKIILHGPPGCGKTLGAERLAWNTGLPVLKVRFDSILSSFFGESASNLRAIFDAANEKPCLLLLDECDFIARSRTTKNDVGEIPRIVNTLLQLLEEYDLPGLLVATTNLEDSLDDALFRRFDDVFEVPKPGKAEIRKLLDMTLSSMKVSKEVNWPKIMEQISGYSAANVVTIAQNAAKSCVLAGEDEVKQVYIEAAISEAKRKS